MAIQWITPTFITRTKGHNALAAVAYRANAKLYCERTGQTFDFRNKSDCVYAQTLLPESAFIDGLNNQNHPFLDRERLWNSVEEIENSHNRRASARLALELKVALPKELNLGQQRALLSEFIQTRYVDKHSVAADIFIHDKGDDNPHGHVMITLRQVVGASFSKKKERGIADPIVASAHGLYNMKGDLPGEWRDFQNEYFKLHNIDLQVDQTSIVATKHEGRVENKENYHSTLADQNEQIKQDNIQIAKDHPDVVLRVLEKRQSVFNDRDIKSLILKVTDNVADFDRLYNHVLADDRMIKLGFDDAGRMAFTTVDTFKRESELIELSQGLSGRASHVVDVKLINRVASDFTLSDDQKEALKFIAQGGDLTCLDGIAGAGKTHAMKAVKAIYDDLGVAVYGGAIAGKAAHGLESEAGIQSTTIHSMVKCYRKGGHYHNYLPQCGSVLIIDEAGMVGLDDMHALLKMTKERNIKLLAIGDMDQLPSIARGAPLKAMVDRVGCASLSEVRRQKDAGDRVATGLLKQGQVGGAIDHYLGRDQIILDTADALYRRMIAKWQVARNTPLDDGSDRSVMMLAFTRDQVSLLNEAARGVLKQEGVLSDTHKLSVSIDGRTKSQEFAVGEQIVLLKNARLGEHSLKRGQLGVIERIDTNEQGVVQALSINLDGQSLFIDLNAYNHFDYGYALTVHKAQGVTVDDALVLAQGYGWDAPLTYVAMSRHRDHLYMYADTDTFDDVHGLKRELSRKGISGLFCRSVACGSHIL